MKLDIDKQVLQSIYLHAEQSYPDECCGFFFGYEKENIRKIIQLKEVINNKEGDKRRRFEINPLDYAKAENYALENKLTLLGVYHSHPEHPAIPSEHDLKQAMPFFSYIIVSVKGSKSVDVRSWQLNEDNGQFEEEEIIQEVTENIQ